MKVFCINDLGWFEVRNYFLFTKEVDCDGPDYGDILTVTREYYEKGELYYDLMEWPPKNNNDGFLASCFIQLSDIDETELVNTIKVETV